MPSKHEIRSAIQALGDARMLTERQFQAIVNGVMAHIERTLRILAAAGPDAGFGPSNAVVSVGTTTIRTMHETVLTIDTALRIEIDRLEDLLDRAAFDPPPPADTTQPDLQLPAPVGPEPTLPEGSTYLDVGDQPVRPVVVDINLPRQGQLGNCYFVASLGAVADRRPDLLNQAVVDHGQAVSVTFAGQTAVVRKTLPVDEQSRLKFGSSPDGSTMMGFIEKAYAQANGGYPQIGKGAYPAVSLSWLTGQTVHFEGSDAGMPDQRLRDLCSADRPTVADTVAIPDGDPMGEVAKQHDVVGHHVYVARGVDENGDVLLHNPWGFFHPKPLPPAVFRQLFRGVTWTD